MEEPEDEIHGAADGSYKPTPSEPTAHGYQPGDEQQSDGDTDPSPGGGAPPAPAEAHPG